MRDKLYRSHTFAIEVQGDHSVKPPIEAIQTLVSVYVTHVFRQWPQSLSFIIQVECARIPVQSFTGVRVITIPPYNPTCVKLRVRIRGDQYQWACGLVCPDQMVARAFISATRPDAANFLDRTSEFLDEHYTVVQQTPDLTERKAQRVNKEVRQLNRLRKALLKRSTLGQLCSFLATSIENTSSGRIPKGEVCRCIKEVTGCEASSTILLRDALAILVAEGVLEPTSRNRGETFETTVVFHEYVEDYRTLEKQEYLKRLEGDLDRLSRLRDASDRERKRAMETAKLCQERSERIQEEINALHLEWHDQQVASNSLQRA